jgi:hypothetical protein
MIRGQLTGITPADEDVLHFVSRRDVLVGASPTLEARAEAHLLDFVGI